MTYNLTIKRFSEVNFGTHPLVLLPQERLQRDFVAVQRVHDGLRYQCGVFHLKGLVGAILLSPAIGVHGPVNAYFMNITSETNAFNISNLVTLKRASYTDHFQVFEMTDYEATAIRHEHEIGLGTDVRLNQQVA